MSDLTNAPDTGASEPVASAPVESSAPAPAESGKSEARALSPREAASKALRETMGNQPNETDRAAAVLKNGAGADDALDKGHAEAVDKAVQGVETASEASERARKGWETRRANQEKAAENERQAETITEAVKAALPKAEEKPAAEAAPATVETKHPDAPKWMTKQTAAEWSKLPEAMKEEIVKRSEGYDKGYADLKAKADRLDELKEFEELSEQYYKQPLSKTLRNYAELDRLMHDDPLAALERLANGIPKIDAEGKNIGTWTLKELSQYIVDQDQDSFHNENADLQRRLDAAERRIADFEKGQEQREAERAERERSQRTETLQTQIAEFAKSKPRFDELWQAIEIELHNPKFEEALRADPIARLTKAYEKAERLNPAPSLSPPAPDLPATDPAAQTRRGTASVSGAPSGSTPAGQRTVAKSPREAARMALAKVGMGSAA